MNLLSSPNLCGLNIVSIQFLNHSGRGETQQRRRAPLCSLRLKHSLIFKLIHYAGLASFVIILSIATSFKAGAQIKQDESFTIENYYKAKWGYADEFIDLWKRNHYPLLKKAQEKGDIIKVSAEKPILHSGEDTRWDFKVTIVFKNTQLAFDPDLTTPYKKQLYPDTEKLVRDEQHRFELLLAHWDVMVENVELK
jgi:hypothetical protein